MKFLLPLLLIATLQTRAQEQYYPDALYFNGTIIHVLSYYSNPNGTRRSQATILFEPNINRRTITTFSENFHENYPIQQVVVQNMNDKDVVIYQPIINAVSVYKQESDNVQVLSSSSGPLVPSRKVYSYDAQNRVSSIEYYNDMKTVKYKDQFSYNPDGTVTKEVLLPDNIMTGKYVISYDDHHNPVKVMMKEYYQQQSDAPKVTTAEERFEYTYDEHDNYITCTSVYNGIVQWTQHREIIYGY